MAKPLFAVLPFLLISGPPQAFPGLGGLTEPFRTKVRRQLPVRTPAVGASRRSQSHVTPFASQRFSPRIAMNHQFQQCGNEKQLQRASNVGRLP
jgi:hypothetical protein